MPMMKIDGQEVEFTPGETIIQVCDRIGNEIPRFCYHEKLHIAGNCRMCLVEVKPGPPKPQASCALPAAENMEVFTSTPMVKKAREGVMEFLLINHPLDCPICDQGGECDLQDQALMYGSGASRYQEMKRSVEDKYMGPLIKTQMTRCIHCTRCIRFVEDVAGVPELGALGRGEHMEVTSYLEHALTSELSANVIDLCPVGALTSRPYAFIARPWELKKTESIDVLDAVGSNIRIDSRGDAVLRVLPRVHEDVNEEWLADKSRYACDGLGNQRLDVPYIRENGKLRAASWQEAFAAIAAKVKGLKGTEMAAIAGNLACTESMVALKDVMEALDVPNLECRQDGANYDVSERGHYILNSSINLLEKADVVLMVGTNPRIEAPLVNSRLRKAYLRGNMKAYAIGVPADLTYPVEQLGNSPTLLADIAAGKHAVAEALKNAKYPVILLGAYALAREDGAAIHTATLQVAKACNVVRDDWNGFNLLQYAASRVGALDIGFVPAKGGKDMAGIIEGIAKKTIKFAYLLGVDEIDMRYFGDAFVVYQGHHGDIGAHRADVILPGAAYTEKDALYVNTEGRVQEAFRAVFAPGEAKEDWKIIRALSEVLGVKLPYDTMEQLRKRIAEEFPVFATLDTVKAGKLDVPAKAAKVDNNGFESGIRNFYMTDPISRASRTMANCTEQVLKQQQPKAA